MLKLCFFQSLTVTFLDSGILGNHYNGNYDPIWDINDEIGMLNAKKGWQVVSLCVRHYFESLTPRNVKKLHSLHRECMLMLLVVGSSLRFKR